MILHPTKAVLHYGPWSFIGFTRHDRLSYLPASLQRALGDVPEDCRSIYHGRCSEIAALAKALRSSAKLDGATVEAWKIRRPGNPKHGERLEPCSSCRVVLDAFGVKW